MIQQLYNFGDKRQQNHCVHCGGRVETKDHAPSKAFLDFPYLHNLLVLPSCWECNNGFSRDEEYLACFIECVIHGTTDPELLTREKVKKALTRNEKLRRQIERSKREGETERGDKLLLWDPNPKAVHRVILKLARCHTAYELNEPRLEDPTHIGILPLHTLSHGQRLDFESCPHFGGLAGWGEVGSRAMQRQVIGINNDIPENGWLVVQEGRYRFMAFGGGGIIIRGVISEYLGFEVFWE